MKSLSASSQKTTINLAEKVVNVIVVVGIGSHVLWEDVTLTTLAINCLVHDFSLVV